MVITYANNRLDLLARQQGMTIREVIDLNRDRFAQRPTPFLDIGEDIRVAGE